MKNWMKTVVPAMAGLAMATSLLVAPGPVAQAAPVVPEVVDAVPAPVDAGTDTGSVITVNPVAYGAGGGLWVDFSKGATVKNRKVVFQRWDGVSAWLPAGSSVKASTVKMNSSGVATLKISPDLTASYRAVAQQMKYKKKLKPTTPSKIGTSGWALDKFDDFTTAGLTGWAPRNEGSYAAWGRRCAAPYASNTSVAGGVANLWVSKEPLNSDKISSALPECTSSINGYKGYSKTTKKSLLKKTPIYRNSMLSTLGSYTIKTGIVAARIKFPKNVGMHSGVWLQSSQPEIDMVESYGYGSSKGITNVVHFNPGKDKKDSKELYKKKQKKSWYSSYHVFSVEWTTSQVTFRVDGVVTKSAKLTTAPADYFIVMSNLTSDWELNKIKDSQLVSSQMKVDWVKTWTKSS